MNRYLEFENEIENIESLLSKLDVIIQILSINLY